MNGTVDSANHGDCSITETTRAGNQPEPVQQKRAGLLNERHDGSVAAGRVGATRPEAKAIPGIHVKDERAMFHGSEATLTGEEESSAPVVMGENPSPAAHARDEEDDIRRPGAVAMTGIGGTDDNTTLTNVEHETTNQPHSNPAIAPGEMEPIVATLVEQGSDEEAHVAQVSPALPAAHAKAATSPRCLILGFVAMACVGAGIAVAVTLPNGNDDDNNDASDQIVSSSEAPTFSPTVWFPRRAITSNEELRAAVQACEYFIPLLELRENYVFSESKLTCIFFFRRR